MQNILRNFCGWIPPTHDEILAVITKASLTAPHRAENIRRAILTACESFGQANCGMAPKLHVIEVLAYRLLPAFEAATISHLSKEGIDRCLSKICEDENIVPPDRWWIQDMLRAYRE